MDTIAYDGIKLQIKSLKSNIMLIEIENTNFG